MNVITFHPRYLISVREKQQQYSKHDLGQVHSALHRNLVIVQKRALTTSGETTIYGNESLRAAEADRKKCAEAKKCHLV